MLGSDPFYFYFIFIFLRGSSPLILFRYPGRGLSSGWLLLMESSLNFRPLTFHLTKKFPFSWPHPQKCRCQDRRSCWQCHCTSSPSGSACTWSCANWLWPEKHAAMPPRMWRNMGNTGRIYLNILMRPDWGDVSLFHNRALTVQDLQPFQIGCLWIHWFITIFLIQIATLGVCRYAPFSDTPSSSWMTPAWNNTINLCSSQLVAQTGHRMT